MICNDRYDIVNEGKNRQMATFHYAGKKTNMQIFACSHNLVSIMGGSTVLQHTTVDLAQLNPKSGPALHRVWLSKNFDKNT